MSPIGKASLLAVAAVALGTTTVARAQNGGAPAAIVEDVAAKGVALQFMDYVKAGRVIRLGAGDRLVLGYLRSCVHETIRGGTVTVGTDESKVVGGTVKRERVECDGGNLALTTEQAGKSAVAVFRKAPRAPAGGAATVSVRIFSTNPFFALRQAAPSVTVERLDREAETLTVAVKARRVDFAALRKSLRPGGIYRAKTARAQVVFSVDAFAQPGGPILSRLVTF